MTDDRWSSSAVELGAKVQWTFAATPAPSTLCLRGYV